MPMIKASGSKGSVASEREAEGEEEKGIERLDCCGGGGSDDVATAAVVVAAAVAIAVSVVGDGFTGTISHARSCTFDNTTFKCLSTASTTPLSTARVPVV